MPKDEVWFKTLTALVDNMWEAVEEAGLEITGFDEEAGGHYTLQGPEIVQLKRRMVCRLGKSLKSVTLRKQ